MKAKVTEQGLLIPKELLEGMEDVEIRREEYAVLITPIEEENPLLRFGREPILGDVDDGSVKLDHYLYDL